MTAIFLILAVTKLHREITTSIHRGKYPGVPITVEAEIIEHTCLHLMHLLPETGLN